MDYSYRVFGKQIVIDATGDIEMDEASRLFNWINAQRWGQRKAYTIVFDSRGVGTTQGALARSEKNAASLFRVSSNTLVSGFMDSKRLAADCA